VPEARPLAEISYPEMQELAEAGARVLNAQAVEFAKERGIALYARASAGGPGETVIRRGPPRAPGRVVGVAGETGLVVLSLANEDPGALSRLLAWLDARSTGGKQLLFEGSAGHASLILSREDLHDYPALEAELLAEGSRVHLRAGVGAVSAIGAGINATFRNVREALAVLTGMGAAVLGLSTSSFRISLLLEESRVPEAMRQLHRRLVVDEVTAPEA
jgi:aspartate kinase